MAVQEGGARAYEVVRELGNTVSRGRWYARQRLAPTDCREWNAPEGFDGRLQQNVDLIFVSQTSYPSVCVHDVTNDSASCQ